MALGSQATNVDTMSTLTGLTHDIFIGKVVDNVRRESKVGRLFTDALPQGDYRLEGQNMVFAARLRFGTGAMASNGNVPDHVPLDPVQGKVTPIRRYRRVALDNMVEMRASGPGAFEDVGTWIFDQLWDSWASMEIRHAIGASTGVLCKVTSRSSSTSFIVEDGYNHDGTNPLLHLSEGAVIGWYDVSASQNGGAGKISTVTPLNYSTNLVTMDSATTWETNVGNALAAGDLIYFATTNDTTKNYFTLERNYAPNGVGTILDPDALATTVFNIPQGDYPRWKPYRKASATFDHLEVSDFFAAHAEKRGMDIDPQNDVVVCHRGPMRQMRRSLMGLQQQAYTGDVLRGGSRGVTVDGIEFMEDSFFYHDVMAVLHTPALFRVNLGADAEFWSGDGSQWSRIADYDGKEAYVVDYLNFFSPHRGAHGALTGIVTADVTDTDFDPIPNY
jgi:hypothetical protein